MFGHKDIETTATVIAITDTPSSMEVNGKSKHELVLDVAATDGPVFRTKAEHWFDILFSPNPGDVLQVSYDPKSHKTKIRTDGDPRYDLRAQEKLRHQQGDAAVDAAMAQPAGTHAESPDPYAGAQYDPELAELVALEREQAAAEAAQPPATWIPSLTPLGAPAPPAPASGPTTGEPDRLRHLQMLRDSGLLTPEEFERLSNPPPAGS
jgi:hypothetical protein